MYIFGSNIAVVKKKYLIVFISLNLYLYLPHLPFRPGRGFWVYVILGHFNSGIWYFLVKIRV